MARSRRVNPDGVFDVDRGSSDRATKRATVLDKAVHTERAETRAGLVDLDRRVEEMPGLRRQQRDRERATPRNLTGDVPHPRMERQLPIPDAIRQPLSSRQRKARSAVKRGVQGRLPQTQQQATARLIENPDRWRQLNDALSDAVGDAQELEDRQRAEVQRIDRAVQAYERVNDRGHVVYCNVRLPAAIVDSRGDLHALLRAHLPAGTAVAFDRFTAGAHNLHQVEDRTAAAGRTAVFEIQTRRGMYLGRSDSVDDTAHLLPRGMRLRVVGTHLARYRRPDGSTGSRQVIQLVDTDPQQNHD